MQSTLLPMPSVLILGSRGRLGAALVVAFARAGWRVLAQMRRAPQAPLPAQVQPLQWPITDTAGIVDQAQGVSVVIHALNPLYTRWEQEAGPLMRQAIEVALRLNARLMFPGNVYEFGNALPAQLRDDTPFVGNTEKARIRIALDADLLAARARGLRSLVLRAGDFFGAGQGSWFDQAIVKSLGKGVLTYPGPLHLKHAWAYVPDLAETFVRLAKQERHLPDFARYHFAGHTVTGEALLSAIEAVMANPAGDTQRPQAALKRKSLPWGVIGLIGKLYRPWGALHEMAYLWEKPHELVNENLLKAIGTEPHTPLSEALRAALAGLGHPPQMLKPSSASSTFQTQQVLR